jgi:hypothetical protein
MTTNISKPHLSAYDIIGFIADIQTSYTDNFKVLESTYHWTAIDARLQVFLQCADVAGNTRLSIALLTFARANGLKTKDWWSQWACYDADRAFNRCPQFDTFVDDKSRQFTHRVQEQLLVTNQIYIESFLRSLARQFNIDRKDFWRLKKDFLQDTLGITATDLTPLTVYQHLRNSLHNKGVHYNAAFPELAFNIGGYPFIFRHGNIVMISWEHIRELQLASSTLVRTICEHPRVTSLAEFEAHNIVILSDD